MSEITIMTTPLKFINHSIEDFAMQVTFDPVFGDGTVVYNLSIIKNEDLDFAISILKDAYKTGVTVSGLVKFFSSGEKIAGYAVPKGCTGICTLCSMTFDGLLIGWHSRQSHRRRGCRNRENAHLCGLPISL